MAVGKSVDDILEFYQEAGKQMFVKANLLRRLRYRYEDEPLAAKLKEVLGAATKFGSDDVKTLLLLVAARFIVRANGLSRQASRMTSTSSQRI